MPDGHARPSRAAVKSLVDEWLEMLDGIRENWNDETAELAQDAYLLGRKVGYQECKVDAIPNSAADLRERIDALLTDDPLGIRIQSMMYHDPVGVTAVLEAIHAWLLEGEDA